MPSLPKISVIGSGSVGSALVLALHKKGYPIVSIVNRTGTSAKSLAKKVGCNKVSTVISDLASTTRILIISVSDDALEATIDQLRSARSLKFGQMFIMHLSGVATSDLLLPLKKKGAAIASVHPIESFPKSLSPGHLSSRLQKCTYGIEGDDEGLAQAERLVGDLGGHILILAKDIKPLYHTACVFASNYLIVLLNAIKELATSAKLSLPWTEIFGPLMTASMQNAITSGPGAALTGPIVRKDFGTLELHLSSLDKNAPQFVPLYIMCGIEAARLLKDSGRITREEYEDIVKQFKKFLHAQPPRKR